jgi:hypothetical protein
MIASSRYTQINHQIPGFTLLLSPTTLSPAIDAAHVMSYVICDPLLTLTWTGVGLKLLTWSRHKRRLVFSYPVYPPVLISKSVSSWLAMTCRACRRRHES